MANVKILNFKFLRLFHSSCKLQYPRGRAPPRAANPGAAYQLSVLDDDQDAKEKLSYDAEGFGELESDFMNVHQQTGQHYREMQQQRDKVRHIMIKNKYFKDEKLPNFLTYAEKEQMKLLHSRDAEEWTAEKLAESFPASVEIVCKVLQAKWKPYTMKRVKSHDESVMRNWEMLRKGEGVDKIPTELREHLQAFANRSWKDLKQKIPQESIQRAALPLPKTNEFSSIITSCQKYTKEQQYTQKLLENKNTQLQHANHKSEDPEDETYISAKIIDRRPMRMQELKQLKLSQADLQQNNPFRLDNEAKPTTDASLEQLAVQTFGNVSGTGVLPKNVSAKSKPLQPNSLNLNVYAEKYQSNEIVITAEECRRMEITKAKDRIRIPRKVWRKGATYRVEDSYYDDDGEFLYRVPGMTGNDKD